MIRAGLALLTLPLAACAARPAVPIGDLQRDGALLTRWGAALDIQAPLPAYPRPTLVRERWLSLNGPWQFEPGLERQPPPLARDLQGSIVVPFPVESALSGVAEHHPRLWYKRTFDLPRDWRGDRVLLHFGAVDWEAEVWVNGRSFPVHRGGYEPFTYDITEALLPLVRQEVMVRVWDPTDAGQQPRGKQVIEPDGIWYTPVTGIWQTVWLEPVPRRGIESLEVSPDPEAGGVTVTVAGQDILGTDVVEIEVLEQGGLVAARRGSVGDTLFVPVPGARLWSPSDPFLYDLRVTRSAVDGTVRDRVSGYFGLRRIELAPGADGAARLHLNGEPVFQMGVLDQGWWPDGLYTAPSDDALREDVATIRAMGFNLVRKHVKVEPERWYFWCDRLGLLVWQDMPNGNNATPESREQFERELEGLIAARGRHPSIVQWVLFNEGWGQYDTERLTERVLELDPTRLVTCASGWTDQGVGHVLDLHSYPGPSRPEVSARRAAVLGEYGGLGLRIEGHTWSEDGWGYRSTRDPEDLAFGYEAIARELRPLIDEGLAAAVYTQLTDVESECNGLMTYDRAVIKVDTQRIARANAGDLPTVRTILPTSRRAGRAWHYRTSTPPRGWMLGRMPSGPEGDAWAEGVGGFGTQGTPGSEVRTEWTQDEIWMRTDFRLGTIPSGSLLVRVHHDEDVEVWLNGRRILEAEGYTTNYQLMRTGLRAEDLLLSGENVLAVHCRQSGGGQYVDVGLALIED